MTYVLGIAILALALGLVVWQRQARRDEMFAGLTPGLLPAPGQPAERVPVGRQPPPVAVRFDPPAGTGPALAGVIAGSRLEPVAVAATLIDLAGRGWLTLRPLDPPAEPQRRGAAPAREWELRAQDPPPADELSRTEQAVLAEAFAAGPVTTLSAFRGRGAGLAQAFAALGTETSERRWLQPPPTISWAAIGSATALVGVFVLLLSRDLFPIGLGLLLGGAVVLFGTRNLPAAVTAEGYAARVQALGFKQYLATAEAEQLRFEAGIERFGRYLPYAMTFGVVDHWRQVFAEALQREAALGNDEVAGFGWLDAGDVLTTLVLVDLLTDGGFLDDFAGGFDPGLDAADSGFGDGSGDGGADSGGFGDGGGFDAGGFDGGGFDGGFD